MKLLLPELRSPRRLSLLHLVFFCVLMMRFVTSCDSCGPGRPGMKRTGPVKKYHNKPLREKQFLPNVDEFSGKASGPPEGKILRKTRRFHDHMVRVSERNRNIIFRDEERTGADRFMTRRCKEKLEILAIMVRNEWPKVKLFVTEAFDENYEHRKQSLHYEGRALDVKTSDRDRKKYGMLARLAVQAGFDWVFFQSKASIHVSCKSEKGEFEEHLKDERCFHAHNSSVLRKTSPDSNTTETIPMTDLRIGDHVLSTDPSSGTPIFSEMIAWIDSDLTSQSAFLRVHTANGRHISLTPSHLVHVFDVSTRAMTTRYARDLSPGDSLMALDNANEASIRNPFSTLTAEKIVRIEPVVAVGSLAPLTRQGTIVVNGISASCYAAVADHKMAHAAFAPFRWWTLLFGVGRSPQPPDDGMHPNMASRTEGVFTLTDLPLMCIVYPVFRAKCAVSEATEHFRAEDREALGKELIRLEEESSDFLSNSMIEEKNIKEEMRLLDILLGRFRAAKSDDQERLIIATMRKLIEKKNLVTELYKNKAANDTRGTQNSNGQASGTNGDPEGTRSPAGRQSEGPAGVGACPVVYVVQRNCNNGEEEGDSDESSNEIRGDGRSQDQLKATQSGE
ncbi:Protein hedgehog [Hypsibius exemplaris]|uniref:Hedgehog protein n=1 Tax=Hypsibius exemplaris TaxID=2072580 RepID=A0A1W0WP82_HYPEX|nr:Protein hedgehog [Hypsibius exemplaris]